MRFETIGRGAIAALCAVLLCAATPAAANQAAAIEALQEGGRILLIRHAQTEPGTGDPSNFAVDDCASQRNLDHRGRDQARRLGEALGAAGVRFERVLSSAWCRCLETAALMLDAAGQADVPVEKFEPLNSFYEDRGPAARRTRDARAAIAAWSGEGVLLMSTHMVNIYGLVDRAVPSGGFFVLEPTGDGFRVIAAATP